MYAAKLKDFYRHVRGGRYLEVLNLINEGVSPNGLFSFNGAWDAPLLEAADKGHKDIVELLINSGAKINCCTMDGWTALHFAAYWGWLELAKSLLNKGANPTGKDNLETPLILASKHGHTVIADLLINSGANVNSCTWYGWTALHFASERGCVELVKSLLNKGARPDGRFFDCAAAGPVFYAACNGHTEIALLLINKGAKFNHSNCYGSTLLHYAAYWGCIRLTRALVDKKAPLDDRRMDGATPLLVAARSSRYKCTDFLIFSGADRNCCDDCGWTALHFACHNRRVRLVKILLKQKVALDLKNAYGFTPLIVVSDKPHLIIAELLIYSGADINSCDDNGWTPLHHLASRRNPEIPLMESLQIIQSLVANSVNINARSSEGKTPLHIAIERDNVEIINCLLNAGADSNLEDNEGESSFDFLIRNRGHNLETIKLCVEKGAYINSTENQTLFEDQLLQESLFQDAVLCSQLIINKFNNRDLPILYNRIASVVRLPRIDELKIKKVIAAKIEKTVKNDIQVRGFCNLSKLAPVPLSMLCVKTLIEL